MTAPHSRREFLKRTAGTLAGLGLAPTLLSGAGRGILASRSRDSLPPRVVGLRSLGGNFVFDPPGLRLEPGEELTWLNMGDFHTTTAFHPDNAGLLAGQVPLRIPEGAEPWHSGVLGLTAGTEFTHRFEVPGVHDYFCQPHYGFGMVGRIVVPHETGTTPRARPDSELNDASRAEMPAVEAVLGPPGRAFEWTARINGVLLLRAHREPAGDAGARIAEGVEADGELGDLLAASGLGDRTFGALHRFAEGVRSGVDYETLVAGADEVKAPLSEAVEGF